MPGKNNLTDAPPLQLRPKMEGTKTLDPGANAVAVQNALPSYLDGEVRLLNFAEDGIDSNTLRWFFAIQTELLADWEKNGRGDGFIHNQTSILECFVKGSLYGLCMQETDSMFERVLDTDPHFMTTPYGGKACYRFPVFCALENNRIDLLWVAERMRRKGLATLLVSLLKQRGVSGADYIDCVPGAMRFWERIGTVTGLHGVAQVDF